jgi:methionyl aminopeptidase
MVEIKTEREIGLMREAGLVVGHTLAALREAVAPGVSTGDLDDLAEQRIRAAGAVPSFKGYHGYPATICTSINNEIVHGIPSYRRTLAEGDLISIDCGAILEGWHGDSAITVAVGEVAPELVKLMEVTEDAMWAGIGAARTGGRVGDISAAIEAAIRPHGYGILRDYGGHGIGTAMHMDPHVLNYGKPGKGLRLVQGMALAIEPMVTLGSERGIELDDGWTVITSDGSLSAHFEHTFVLCPDGLWVTTALDGGLSRLGDKITPRQPR